MAVPVIHGAVIAEEQHDVVMTELEKDEAERKRKEDEKRRKAALAKWRKFLMGMRIVQRIRQEYGEVSEDVVVFGHSKSIGVGNAATTAECSDEAAGGFLPEGYEEVEDKAHHTSSLLPVGEDDADDGGDDAVLTVEHE